MTDLLTNPIDTGDIPALPGETVTRILLPGEAATRDLRHAVLARRPDATGEIPALVDVPLGLTTADLTPAAYSPTPGEPPRPLPVPPPVPGPPPPAPPTAVLTLLDSIAGTDPETPRPLPNPGPPPTPGARHSWNSHRADHYPIVRPAATREIPWAWAPRRQELAPWKVAISAGIAVVVAEVLIAGSILAVVL